MYNKIMATNRKLNALLKRTVRHPLRRFGLDIVRYDGMSRPIIDGSPAILGSFPPWPQRVGTFENYFIHDGYQHRAEPCYSIDHPGSGERWQLEVYKFAREICERDLLKTVCDIGCGSAFKLMKYFGDMTTVGMDVPQTLRLLQKRWPDRCWLVSDFRVTPPFPVDLVIASDVIEHIVLPNELLSYIEVLAPRYIVLSTPDRNLLRLGTHNGPPQNQAHVREWNFAEFDAYISHFFEIEEHFISFPAQATQCVLCKPRNRGTATSSIHL